MPKILLHLRVFEIIMPQGANIIHIGIFLVFLVLVCSHGLVLRDRLNSTLLYAWHDTNFIPSLHVLR